MGHGMAHSHLEDARVVLGVAGGRTELASLGAEVVLVHEVLLMGEVLLELFERGHREVRKTGDGLGTLNTEEKNGHGSGQWPID